MTNFKRAARIAASLFGLVFYLSQQRRRLTGYLQGSSVALSNTAECVCPRAAGNMTSVNTSHIILGDKKGSICVYLEKKYIIYRFCANCEATTSQIMTFLVVVFVFSAERAANVQIHPSLFVH